MKYIPADKLIAEIDDIIEMAEERWDNEQITGVKKFCDLLYDKIVFLQQEQPEVDLKKEVKWWKNKHGVVGMDDLWLDIAKYFFELGKNTRKDE